MTVERERNRAILAAMREGGTAVGFVAVMLTMAMLLWGAFGGVIGGALSLTGVGSILVVMMAVRELRVRYAIGVLRETMTAHDPRLARAELLLDQLERRGMQVRSIRRALHTEVNRLAELEKAANAQVDSSPKKRARMATAWNVRERRMRHLLDELEQLYVEGDDHESDDLTDSLERVRDERARQQAMREVARAL